MTQAGGAERWVNGGINFSEGRIEKKWGKWQTERTKRKEIGGECGVIWRVVAARLRE